ncbi:MAG: hypothetical protein Q8Q04_03105 [archaeon]|nr:hypothetical protein [archaeon]
MGVGFVILLDFEMSKLVPGHKRPKKKSVDLDFIKDFKKRQIEEAPIKTPS